MKHILTIGLLVLITALILFVRLYKLDQVPVHLGNDEISIAYDAYSVGLTGRDEHNRYLPLSFQSHGTYKAPLYAYLSILPIKVLGNSEVAVRLISVLSGLLTIIVLGFLTYQLTNNKSLVLMASIILGLTPWHIYASRIALESNLALLFMTTGIFAFLQTYKTNKNLWLMISIITFAASVYSYHTEWLLTPLLVLALPILLPLKKTIFNYLFWLFTIVLCLPIFLDFVHNFGTNARANTEMLWNNPTINNYLVGNHDILSKISLLVSSLITNYFSYLNPGYLFFHGLVLLPQITPYQVGLLLCVSSPFLIIGLLLTKKYLGKYYLFFLVWLLSSPMVAALTTGGQNFVRNLPSVIPYSILITIGLHYIWHRSQVLVKIIIVSLSAISFGYFCAFYLVHFPKYSGENWQYGYKQIAQYIISRYHQYSQIIVDPRFGPNNRYAGVPHLYIGYFTKLNPQSLLNRTDVNGLYFDKYRIADLDWKNEQNNIQFSSLYVVPVSNLPPGNVDLVSVTTIYLPNGQPEFKIYETRNE